MATIEVNNIQATDIGSFVEVDITIATAFDYLEIDIINAITSNTAEVDIQTEISFRLWTSIIYDSWVEPQYHKGDETIIIPQTTINGGVSGGTPGGSITYETNSSNLADPFGFNLTTNNEGYSLTQIAPEVIPSFIVMLNSGKKDMSNFLLTLDITRNLGGKSSFTATFAQTDEYPGVPELNGYFVKDKQDINTLYRGKNEYENTILHHNFTKDRFIEITLNVGNVFNRQIWKAPLFAPGTSSFDGHELKWSGEDMSCLFEQENQTLVDIEPDDTPKIKAHKCIEDIFVSKGFSKDKLSFGEEFKDYEIRQLRRQGDRPLNWMDEIALIYQAQRYWDYDKMYWIVPKNPGVDGGTVAYKLIDNINVLQENVEIDELMDWCNSFNISRVKTAKGVFGSKPCGPGPECPGRTIKITFDEPLYYVRLEVRYIGDCHIENYVYFDEQNRPLNDYPLGPIYVGAVKAARVEATCVPHYTNGVNYVVGSGGGGQYNTPNSFAVNEVGYEIFVRGTNTPDKEIEPYTFTLNDPDTVELYGEIKDYQNKESTLIPNAKVAEDYLKAILKENIRKIYKATVKLPLGMINPFMNPGDVIEMTDNLTDQVGVKWLLEEIHISWDGQEWTQDLVMYRGLM